MPRKFKTQDGKSSEAIRGLWEGAYVSQFVRLFQRKFGFQSLTTQELEDALLDPESLVIPDLCARLLRFLTKQSTILISNFEQCLQDLLQRRQVSFSKSPWWDLTPREKLSTLKWLLDHAYESEEEELTEFLDDHYDPDDLRGICVGQDAFDNVYWYLEDLRLYREAKKAQRGSSGPGEWDCICVTLSDWQLFLKQFRKSSNPQEKQLHAFLGCHLFPLVQARARSLQERDRATENRWLLEREQEEVSRSQAMKCNGASSVDAPEAPAVAPSVATPGDLSDCKLPSSASAKEEEGPPSCTGPQQQTPPSVPAGQGGPQRRASPPGATVVNGGGAGGSCAGPPPARDCGPPPLIEASTLQPLSDAPNDSSVTGSKENGPPVPGPSPDMVTGNNVLPPHLQQQQQAQVPPQHPSMMMMGGPGGPTTPMSAMAGGGNMLPHHMGVGGCSPHHPMGGPGPHTGGPHPGMPVQALPSNLGVGPPKGVQGGHPSHPHHQGGLDAQYMQQQSQIFVFTTALANQAAEAVLTGQCPSIIAFHCVQPGTKRFLEKHPLKIQQFNKQSPAAWLNSLAQMKQQRGAAPLGPIKGAPLPQHFGGPAPHPQGSGPPFCGPQHAFGLPHAGGSPAAWQQQQQQQQQMGAGVPPQEMWGSGAAPYCPGGGGGGSKAARPPPGGHQGCCPPNGGGGAPCFPGGFQASPACGTAAGNQSHSTTVGVKVPDENLTPQQRQHREEQLAMIRKMHQLLFPDQHGATGMPPASGGPQQPTGGPQQPTGGPQRPGMHDHHHGGPPSVTAPHGGPHLHPAFQGCVDHQHHEGGLGTPHFPGGPAGVTPQHPVPLQSEWQGMHQQQKPYYDDRRRKTPTHPLPSSGAASFGASGPCTPEFVHSPSSIQGGPHTYGPTRPGSCPNPNFNGPTTRPASCTGFNSPGSFSNPPTPSNFTGVSTPGTVAACRASPGPGMVFSPGPNPCVGTTQGGYGNHSTPCSAGFAGGGTGGACLSGSARPSPCSVGFGGGQGGSQVSSCGSPALQPFSPVRPGTSPTGQGFSSGPSPTHYGNSSPGVPRPQAPPSPAGASPRIGPPPPYTGGSTTSRGGSLASPHPPASPLPSPAADPSRQFAPRLTNPSPGSMQTTPLSSPKPSGRPGSAGGRAPATPTTPVTIPSPSSAGKKRAATPLQENQQVMQDFASNGNSGSAGDQSAAGFSRNLGNPGVSQHPQAMAPGGASSSKEPSLMPVPSPQQIQYLSTLEGQELTIQKQPNTGLHMQEGQPQPPQAATAAVGSGNAQQHQQASAQPPQHLLAGMPHADVLPLDMGPAMTSENSQGSFHSSCSSGGDVNNPRFPPTTEVNPSAFDGQQRFPPHEPHYAPSGYVDHHQPRFGVPHPQGGTFPDGMGPQRYQGPPQGPFPMNPRDFGSPAGHDVSMMNRAQSFRMAGFATETTPSPHIQNLQKMAPPFDASKGQGGRLPDLVQDPLDTAGGSPEGGMPPTADYVAMMPQHGGARPPYVQPNVGNAPARSSPGTGRGTRGRSSATFGGMQAKPNAPNTIQYLPARPQGPQRAPGLDFLQRFAAPLTNLDAKVPTQNLQYFPPSGPPRSPMMMRSGGSYVAPNGTHVSGAPPMPMMGAAGPFPGKQVLTGPHGEVAQPLPPTVGQAFGYKQPPFYGPTTADPNYAVQFHNFQQQLYATNTRSQGGSSSQGGAGFFGPK